MFRYTKNRENDTMKYAIVHGVRTHISKVQIGTIVKVFGKRMVWYWLAKQNNVNIVKESMFPLYLKVSRYFKI